MEAIEIATISQSLFNVPKKYAKTITAKALIVY